MRTYKVTNGHMNWVEPRVKHYTGTNDDRHLTSFTFYFCYTCGAYK